MTIYIFICLFFILMSKGNQKILKVHRPKLHATKQQISRVLVQKRSHRIIRRIQNEDVGRRRGGPVPVGSKIRNIWKRSRRLDPCRELPHLSLKLVGVTLPEEAGLLTPSPRLCYAIGAQRRRCACTCELQRTLWVCACLCTQQQDISCICVCVNQVTDLASFQLLCDYFLWANIESWHAIH